MRVTDGEDCRRCVFVPLGSAESNRCLGSNRRVGCAATTADQAAARPWSFARAATLAITRWVDSFWGYDVFIAHRRADAAEYAVALRNTLQAERIGCFLDQVVYGPGDSLLVATKRHVRKSTLLVVVGSPELLIPRRPVDWIEREIETYTAHRGDEARIVVIDFGNRIREALEGSSPDVACPPYVERLRPDLSLFEPADALSHHPSEAVVGPIRRQLKGRRRERGRVRFFQSVAAVLLVLLLLTSLGGWISYVQRNEALRTSSRFLASTAQLLSEEKGLHAWAEALAWTGLPHRDDVLRVFDRPLVPETLRAFVEARVYQRAREVPIHRAGNRVEAAMFSPSGSLLATAASDGTVMVSELDKLDASSNLPSRALDHDDAVVHSLSFSESDSTLLTLAMDSVVRVWTLGDDVKVRELRGHSGRVIAGFIGPSETWAVTASEDGTVRRWDLASGRDEVLYVTSNVAIASILRHPQQDAAIVVSTGGRIVRASPDQAGSYPAALK